MPTRGRWRSHWRAAAAGGRGRLARGKLYVEMLLDGDDWHGVGWPFTRRADAERARATLLARGLKVEVVNF